MNFRKTSELSVITVTRQYYWKLGGTGKRMLHLLHQQSILDWDSLRWSHGGNDWGHKGTTVQLHGRSSSNNSSYALVLTDVCLLKRRCDLMLYTEYDVVSLAVLKLHRRGLLQNLFERSLGRSTRQRGEQNSIDGRWKQSSECRQKRHIPF